MRWHPIRSQTSPLLCELMKRVRVAVNRVSPVSRVSRVSNANSAKAGSLASHVNHGIVLVPMAIRENQDLQDSPPRKAFLRFRSNHSLMTRFARAPMPWRRPWSCRPMRSRLKKVRKSVVVAAVAVAADAVSVMLRATPQRIPQRTLLARPQENRRRAM